MKVKVQIQKNLKEFQLDVCFSGQARRIGILGASGSGKSMTLKCIAGIELPDTGMIQIEDKVLFDFSKKICIKTQKRRVGYLFQNYALFPTMTVAKNIEAGLKGNQIEKHRRVEEMIKKFRLSGLENRLPYELSGGQQQRVALARIMAYQPDMILLDEPFSALDVFLKDQLQQEMTEMLADYSGLVILVSHSRDEIYRFSEELLVLDKGRDVIYGKTEDIFANPVYREAARLTGCKNLSNIKRIDAYTVEAVDWGVLLHLKKPVSDRVIAVGYRAHDFIPVWGEREENCISVKIADKAKLPFEQNYYLFPEGKKKETGWICWFVQRDRIPEIEQKGIPDFLKIQEEKIMFLL